MNRVIKETKNKLSEDQIAQLINDNLKFVYSTVNKNFAKYIIIPILFSLAGVIRLVVALIIKRKN